MKVEIKLEKLHKKDAEKLFEFELENRDFFETMVPSRGDDYYTFETFIKKLDALLKEQEKRLATFYLIKDQNTGSILGRINLIDIDELESIAQVGYRVGWKHTGKGIAKKALRLLISTIQDELRNVEAKTTNNNIASQKVLEKNGFKRIKISNEEFMLNGKKLKFVYYRWSKSIN